MFYVTFILALCFSFSVWGFFPQQGGVNCALPLYMQALQSGYGQGPSEASLRRKQERLEEQLENVNSAIDEIVSDTISGRINHAEEDGLYIADQIAEYIEEDFDFAEAECEYCGECNTGRRGRRANNSYFLHESVREIEFLTFLSVVGGGLNTLIAPATGEDTSADALGGTSRSDSPPANPCENKQKQGGIWTPLEGDCVCSGIAIGDTCFSEFSAKQHCKSKSKTLVGNTCQTLIETAEAGKEQAEKDYAKQKAQEARERALEKARLEKARLAKRNARKKADADRLKQIAEAEAKRKRREAEARARAREEQRRQQEQLAREASGNIGTQPTGTTVAGGGAPTPTPTPTQPPAQPPAGADPLRGPATADEGDGENTLLGSSTCKAWKRWGRCAGKGRSGSHRRSRGKKSSKKSVSEAICKAPQTCALDGGTPLSLDNSYRSRECRDALKRLKKYIKDKQKLEKKLEELDEDIYKLAETEGEYCDDCMERRLTKLKEIIDPAPKWYETLGNVLGTVGAAALGYYGIKEANKMRDMQGYSAQPQYALGLAYPFIMKGLYGGGLFGKTNSMACSPTAFGNQAGVFGNPFLQQQMMYAQQQHYMQQMYLQQQMYSGGFPGGMMPGMGGFIVQAGGMFGGMQMPGMGMPGMGGFIVQAGGMFGGMQMPGMGMPGMGGFIVQAGGMFGGMQMPGMGMPGMGGFIVQAGGMFGGMQMAGMMPGMGGMQMPGGMQGGQAYIQYQQARLAYMQAQMNNYMQRTQAASHLATEIQRLQMQYYQVMAGTGSGNLVPLAGGGGNTITPGGGGGKTTDDGSSSIEIGGGQRRVYRGI